MNSKNKLKIINIIIIILTILLSSNFIPIIPILIGDKWMLILFITEFSAFIVLCFIKNSFERKYFNEKYKNFSTNISDFNGDKSDDNFIIEHNHLKKYVSLDMQEKIESEIKEYDVNFNKIDFKQRAIARFNILQRCYKNQNIKELEMIENKIFFDYQSKNIKSFKGISNYDILYSDIDLFETKNNYNFLRFNVSIRYKKDKKVVVEETYIMIFSKKLEEKTISTSTVHTKKCPNCGGTVSYDLITCNYCNKFLPDDFIWKLNDFYLYNKGVK